MPVDIFFAKMSHLVSYCTPKGINLCILLLLYLASNQQNIRLRRAENCHVVVCLVDFIVSFITLPQLTHTCGCLCTRDQMITVIGNAFLYVGSMLLWFLDSMFIMFSTV